MKNPAMKISSKTLSIATVSVATASALLLAPLAAAQTPWLPAPGATDLSLSFTNQKADDFKPGTASAKLPSTLKQDTFSLSLTHGLADAVALDATIGYGKSSFIRVPGLAPNGGLSGITDSRIGVRYRVLDDIANDPLTVTFGAAAILKGDYDTGALSAIGDGANALEVSVAVGKLVTSKLSVYGVLGYRDRQSPVPKEMFYRLGATVNFTPQFYAGAEYQKVDARGGLDIGGPGFSPARFREVQEDYSLTSASLGFRFNNAVTAAIQFGEKKGERNTAESKVVGVSLTTSF